MKPSFIVITAALLGSPAFAQEVQQEYQTSARSSTRAMNNALEITLGAG